MISFIEGKMRLHPDDITAIVDQLFDKLMEAKKARKPRQAKAEAYTKEFELCWSRYPKRPNNNKQDAYRVFLRRLEEGEEIGHLLACTTEYAEFCKATGKIGKETVLQASTFYGPSKRYKDDFTLPKEEPEWAKIPKNNNDLEKWALANGFKGPSRGQSWIEYRQYLNSEVEKKRLAP